MNSKNISSLILAISLGIFLGSCGNNSTKKADAPESKKQEAAESAKPDSALFKTVLPDGEITLDRLPAV